MMHPYGPFPRQGVRGGFPRPVGAWFPRVAWLFFLLIAGGFGARDPATEEPEFWIRRLGAPTHAEREEASSALWSIGEPALDLLRVAAEDPDPEIAGRARRLWADITDGIRPEWPAILQQGLRGFDHLPAGQRSALLDELIRDRGDEAAPFLLNRVRRDGTGGAAAEAGRLEALAESARVRQWILDRIRSPRHEAEARVLAAACLKEGRPADLARALGSEHVPQAMRDRLASAALQFLQGRHDAREFERLSSEAAVLSAAAPDEARFLYFEAAGASHLGDSARAEALCRKALDLNPGTEAPHFAAGELLVRLGQPRLAAWEWRRILDIPPENDVYDINARFRLGAMHADHKEFTEAADQYERGLEAYQAARSRGGSGMGILGGSEEELAGMIASLRERAAAQPSEANARWSVRIEIQAKGDRTRELDEMHALADLIMTVNVQPHGIRIFEAAPATFQYDRVRGEFVVMLGDAPAAPGFRHALKGGATRVLLRALDMQYLFEFDGETGVAVKRNAVELDYTLRLEPPGEIRAWQDPQITINGHPHAWEDLREGVPYDILPEQILLKVRGTAPNGEVREIQATIHPGRLEADGMRPPAPENPADPAPPP